MTLFPTLVGACFATFAIGGWLAALRLKALKERRALAPEMAAYFAPVTDAPLVRLSIGWESRRTAQTDRMQSGRMLKLLIGREHALIGDRWLTALVYAQRLAVLGAAGLVLARATHALPIS